jgi:hypothetical protein
MAKLAIPRTRDRAWYSITLFITEESAPQMEPTLYFGRSFGPVAMVATL